MAFKLSNNCILGRFKYVLAGPLWRSQSTPDEHVVTIITYEIECDHCGAEWRRTRGRSRHIRGHILYRRGRGRRARPNYRDRAARRVCSERLWCSSSDKWTTVYLFYILRIRQQIIIYEYTSRWRGARASQFHRSYKWVWMYVLYKKPSKLYTWVRVVCDGGDSVYRSRVYRMILWPRSPHKLDSLAMKRIRTMCILSSSGSTLFRVKLLVQKFHPATIRVQKRLGMALHFS